MRPIGQDPAQVAASATPGARELEGVQTPALTLEKVAPPEVQVDVPATFELVVRNTGSVAAHDVTVYDRVPDGADLVEAVPEAQRAANGQLTWPLGTIEPGASRTIRLSLLPKQPGQLGSVARITFAAEASVRTICTQPQLDLRQSAPPRVLIGQDVIVNISIDNKGDGPANDVVIQEDVPEGLEFSGGLRELEYDIGTLAPGQSRQVQLKLRAARVGSVRNVLVAHGKGNLRATAAADIEIIAPQLVAIADGPSRRYLQREANHSLDLANTGTANATHVEVAARLPRGLQFVNASAQGRYDPRSHIVMWSMPELPPGSNVKLELATMPVETGQQTIDFDVVADLNQNQQVEHTVLVEQLAELVFNINDTADPIEVGSQTSYQVQLANQGSKPATNVRVQVDFPADVQPTSVDGPVGAEIRGATVVFSPLARMEAGQQMTLVIKAVGRRDGDHRVVVSLSSDDRPTPVSKEESTRVYSDR
jgi:uncharacterized repeat protein (TIGR01451 family)